MRLIPTSLASCENVLYWRVTSLPAPAAPVHVQVALNANWSVPRVLARDRAALVARCAMLDAAGFERSAPHNPYWARHGVTYVDPEGYHVVVAVAD